MEKSKANKPQWLLQLEQESWQAELIISGLAIFGSLQLPEIIGRFGQWALTYFSVSMGPFLYFIQLYLFFAACGLIIGFILHFVLRAIWIGLIGINSVFPEGIKTESDSYSKIFMENIKRDYSIENSGIEALDKLCSGVFVACSILLLVSCVFVVDLIVVYGIKCLLDFFMPVKIQMILAGVLLFSVMGVSILFMVMNSKKYHNNINVQEKGYKVYTIYSFLIFHIFRKPYFYLVNLVISNVDKKKFIGWMMAGMMIVFAFAGYQLFQSKNIFLMDSARFLSGYERSDITFIEEYEEHLSTDGGPIYSALIESELIKGKMMKVFVPIFNNEDVVYSAYCGDYIGQENLDRDQNRRQARQFYVDCYNKYHRVSINEEIVATDFIKHTHPHRATYGVLTYLPTANFKKGKNFLKVEKLSVEGVYRTMVVPFWFAGS